MKKNNYKNSFNLIEKQLGQYKIIIIPDYFLLTIRIQSHNLNIYESCFNLDNLYIFNSFISNFTIEEIIKYICESIEQNNIKITKNKKYMKFTLISKIKNQSNIELILNKKVKYFINSIKAHNDIISTISIFPSGNIISVSFDQSIKIFDIHLNVIQVIEKAHDDIILYVDVKNDNNFITCSTDKNIKIWIKEENEFKLNSIIKNAHNDLIYKVIYSNYHLISCSADKTIKIWENVNNNYQNITILTHSNCVYSILLIEDKNILISSGMDGTKFWSLNNFNCLFHIKETWCIYWNSLCRIDEDKIIVQSKYPNTTLKVISISEKKINDEIKINFYCRGITFIKNKGIILIGGSKDINIFHKDNYNCIKIIKNADDGLIDGFIGLKNGMVLSYGNNMQIKLWLF